MGDSKPACPRCGYDLQGQLDTWDGACPLDGTCSECGLAFHWGELLRPEQFVDRQNFESAPRAGVAALIITVSRCLRPWVLWRRLRLSDSRRWHRAAVVGLIAPLLAAIVLGVGLPALAIWPGGLERVATYRATIGPGIVVGEAIEIPLRFEGYASERYGVELELLSVRWVSGVSLSELLEDWATRWSWSVEYLLESLAWWVLIPVAFALLGQSLGRVGVRRGHLLRAAMYSGWFPLFGVVLALVGEWVWVGIEIYTGDNPYWFADWPFAVAQAFYYARMFVFIVGLSVFWWAVTAFYLRLPNPILTTVLTLLASGLAVATASVLLWITRVGA